MKQTRIIELLESEIKKEVGLLEISVSGICLNWDNVDKSLLTILKLRDKHHEEFRKLFKKEVINTDENKKMTSISIHNIKKVTFGKVEKKTIENENRIFYCREIVITCDDGSKTTLNLFSKEENNLYNTDEE